MPSKKTEADRPSQKATVAEPLLPKAWGVPADFRARLGNEAGRQRLMQAEGHLLLVLHAPPAPGQDIRYGKTFWRNAIGEWKPVAMSHNQHPIDELLDEYDRVLDTLDRDQDDAHYAEDYFTLLTALTPLVRSIHNLHAVLHEARQACREDRGLILVRDRAYALSRRAELLQQDAKNTLDFVIARRAEEQAESARGQAKAAHRLNVLAALFFPLATVAGVLGMDLAHGLEGIDQTHAPWPMVGVLTGGLLLGAALAVFVTRR
ncbi:MAG: CorA family divalent cation transporter [Planctomycetota bacterium]